jgi:hypothetical protein
VEASAVPLSVGANPYILKRQIVKTRNLLAVLMLALSGCGTIKNLFTYSSTGELVLQPPHGEAQHLTADQCRSGELSGFLGFDLASSTAGWQIRALVDPMSGPAVKVTTGSGELMLHNADCSVLNINAHPSGLSINDVNSYDGFLEMACTASGGAHINGRIDVHNCPGGY